MTTHTVTSLARFVSHAARPSPQVTVMAAAIFVLLFCAPSTASAITRWVNDDAANYAPPGTSCVTAGYATIQAAVNAASAGDVIRVCPGKYVENVVIATNNLTVISTLGRAATMITAARSSYVVLIAATAATVRGFTIIPAGEADGDIGINVGVSGSTGLRVRDNAIFGGRIGINLGCVSAGSQVSYNTVHGQTEAGINIDTCEAPPFPGSHRNTIQHNVACSITPTASIALGGASNNNRIQYNIATTISAFGNNNLLRYNTTQAAIVDNGTGTVLNNNLVDGGVCPTIP